MRIGKSKEGDFYICTRFYYILPQPIGPQVDSDHNIHDGYLVLADISGYTGYIAETDLAQARRVLDELIQFLIQSLTPAMTLAEVEGDAVFVYAPASRFEREETLLELLETAYRGFRNIAPTLITSCGCEGCVSVEALDLKFVVHRGEYSLQRFSGRDKPLGADVVLVHRLLKNSVTQSTGWRGYMLWTKRALRSIAIHSDDLSVSEETYDHFGTFPVYALNLGSRFTAEAERQIRSSYDRTPDQSLTIDCRASQAVVWEWLHDPRKRSLWSKLDWTAGNRSTGRTQAGATNQCTYRKGKYLERILVWKPFDFYASRISRGLFSAVVSFRLEPRVGGTRLVWQVVFEGPSVLRPVLIFIFRKMVRMEKRLRELQELVGRDITLPSHT